MHGTHSDDHRSESGHPGDAPSPGSSGPSVPEMPHAVDVLVIGGGIAGASVLYHLGRLGVSALLVERGELGRGATSAAAGALAPPVRQPFHETVHDRGQDAAAAIWGFAMRSVAGLAEALEGMGAAAEVELDMRGGHVMCEAHSEVHVRRAFEALDRAGFHVDWLDREAARAVTGAQTLSGGYRLHGTGALDPSAATRALARDAVGQGCAVQEGVTIRDVTRKDGKLTATWETQGRVRGEIHAAMVVYATHTDSRRFSALVGDEIVPIRGQGLRARVEGIPEQPGCLATHWKMNVWRQAADGLLWVSGWRHNAWDRSYWKTRPELDDRLQQDIEEWVKLTFPGARVEVEDRWSGIFGWTSDYLPLVGPLPGSPDELVISGFSGGGLPFAFEAGRILANAIADHDPVEGASMFNPRRFL